MNIQIFVVLLLLGLSSINHAMIIRGTTVPSGFNRTQGFTISTIKTTTTTVTTTTTTTTLPPCFMPNYLFSGGDLVEGYVLKNNAQECRDQCLSEGPCLIFTFVEPNSCYTKDTSYVSSGYHASSTSGYKHCA